jgi:hypothetical protein
MKTMKVYINKKPVFIAGTKAMCLAHLVQSVLFEAVRDCGIILNGLLIAKNEYYKIRLKHKDKIDFLRQEEPGRASG